MKPTLRTAALVLLVLLAPSPALAAGDWRWPVFGEVLTHYRNGNDPYAAGQHRGIDIAAPDGTPVLAATAGEVQFAGLVGSSGQTVSVRTADGRFDLSYLHLSATEVRAGEHVAAGARLGAVGRTGQRSVDAPHLHFGVRDAGTDHAYRDPLDFLTAAAAPPAAPAVPDPALGTPAPAGVESAPAGPLTEAVAPADPAPTPRLESAPASPGLARPSTRISAPAVAASARASGRAEARGRAGTSRSLLTPARPAPVRGRALAAAEHPTSRGRAATNLGVAPGGHRPAPESPSRASSARRPSEAVTLPPEAAVRTAPAARSGGARTGWWVACLGVALLAALGGRTAGRVAHPRRRVGPAGPAPEPAATQAPDAPSAAPAAALAVPEGARASTSIDAACPSTSRRRSTTSTPSRISATRTRRSRPTSSRATCASGERTSSS